MNLNIDTAAADQTVVTVAHTGIIGYATMDPETGWWHAENGHGQKLGIHENRRVAEELVILWAYKVAVAR